MKQILVLFIFILFFSTGSVSASDNRVVLSHESLTLPSYVSPVDVSTKEYAEFMCADNPDECAVFVGFYPSNGDNSAFNNQDMVTGVLVDNFSEQMKPRYQSINGGSYHSNVTYGYETQTGIFGVRERILVSDTWTNRGFAVDFFFHYSFNGDTTMILYLRPIAWLDSANGNGQPIMEQMLDSLVLQ